MIEKELVKYILKTYDLKPKLEDKLTAIALGAIEERALSDFDGIYRYIADLTEKFQIPFKEIKALRLDAPVGFDSQKTFYELLPAKPSESQFNENSEEPEQTTGTPINEALHLLEGRMDSLDLQLMKQLLKENNGNNVLALSPEEIVSRSGQIQQRLTELAYKYEKEGSLIIPKRPIVYIEFNPLAIRFGRRRYHGNPLAFFRENERVYEGLSRGELHKFDVGLYIALRRTRQLEDAIPKNYRGEESPLAYLHAHPEKYEGLSRGELQKIDNPLYHALWKADQLEDANLLDKMTNEVRVQRMIIALNKKKD